MDLTNREDVKLLRSAHDSFISFQKQTDFPVPENKNPGSSENGDRVLRFLDCAVFRHLHKTIDLLAEREPDFNVFDTVRGMFVEGEPIYDGSGIYKKPCSNSSKKY